MLQKLETALDGVLGKKSSIKLPDDVRKSLSKAMWIIALVVGILQLWSAWQLWDWGRKVNEAVDYFNSFSSYYGGNTTEGLGLFFWTSLVVMAVVAVMILLATPHLKAMKKNGWNLLFYAVLLEALVAVLRIFSNVGGGMDDFLMAAIGAAIGAYVLFQTRDYFSGASASSAPAAKK